MTHQGAPVRAAAAATEADAPDALLRLRETGGLKRGVTFAQIARARKQALAINSTTGSWEYAGANNIGGRVTDVVVDPTQANTIYVASAGGGVWKSTDAGATYTPAWPNNYPQAIGSLARGSDGTLWAGTGEANASGGGITYVGDGVYKSTDGGATWTNVGIGNAGMIGRIAVDPANPNIVLVAASGSIYSTGGKRGLYRTIDAGAHWAPVLVPDLNAAPYTGAVDVAFDPVNPNRVYATLWDHHRSSYLRPYGGIGSGLYVTDNALETPAADVTWERIGNSHVSGPLPSYDASQSGLDVSPTLGRMGVAVAPSDHTRVYLITGESLGNDKGFFVSDNGDRSLADGGPTFVAGGHAGGNPRFEWWFGRLFVDPVNKNHLFKTDVSLRRSSDGGTTWANVGGPHADQHAMAWDPNVRTGSTSATTAASTAPTRTATAAGCTARTCRGSRSTTSPSRRRGRTGSRSGSRTTARTAAGRTSTTPSPTRRRRTGPRTAAATATTSSSTRPTTPTTTRAARTPAAAASTTSPRRRRRCRPRPLSARRT